MEPGRLSESDGLTKVEPRGSSAAQLEIAGLEEERCEDSGEGARLGELAGDPQADGLLHQALGQQEAGFMTQIWPAIDVNDGESAHGQQEDSVENGQVGRVLQLHAELGFVDEWVDGIQIGEEEVDTAMQEAVILDRSHATPEARRTQVAVHKGRTKVDGGLDLGERIHAV